MSSARPSDDERSTFPPVVYGFAFFRFFAQPVSAAPRVGELPLLDASEAPALSL